MTTSTQKNTLRTVSALSTLHSEYSAQREVALSGLKDRGREVSARLTAFLAALDSDTTAVTIEQFRDLREIVGEAPISAFLDAAMKLSHVEALRFAPTVGEVRAAQVEPVLRKVALPAPSPKQATSNGSTQAPVQPKTSAAPSKPGVLSLTGNAAWNAHSARKAVRDSVHAANWPPVKVQRVLLSLAGARTHSEIVEVARKSGLVIETA